MTETEERTVAVMTAHVQALGQGIDDILRRYIEASVVFAPEGPWPMIAMMRHRPPPPRPMARGDTRHRQWIVIGRCRAWSRPTRLMS